jgi:DNA-binding NtrC family response regulator
MTATAQSPVAWMPERRIATQTILIVDDENEVRTLVGDALERAGYAVLEASDAREALESVEHHDAPIQLIITDLGLPDADGRDLAAQLLLVRPEAKIMFMSGSATLEAATNAPFMQKPFALGDLIVRVRGLI